jgi:hypothetical protein
MMTQPSDPATAMSATVSTPRILAAALLTVTLAACASHPSVDRVPFTEGLIDDYALTPEHRQHLQYYLSDTITLSRAFSDGQRGVSRGRLVERSGTMMEAVKIAAGTPGVVVGSGDGWVAVSFAPGSYLYFVSAPSGADGYFSNNHVGDRYYVFSPNGDGHHGTVRLDGYDFEAEGSTLKVYLLVDQDSLNRSDSRESTLPGRWLVERR